MATAERLCGLGLLTQEQLREALSHAKSYNVKLPDVLAAVFGISGQTWARERAASANLPLADLVLQPPSDALTVVNDKAPGEIVDAILKEVGSRQ